MTTHETDQPQEIDHADENYGVDSEGDELAQDQAAEAEEAEPVADDLDRDSADAPEAEGATVDEDEIDTEGLADPDADVADEAEAFGEPDIAATDDVEAGTDAGPEDESVHDPIALGPVDVDDEADEEPVDDEPADEPVIVELDETEVEVLDEPADDSDDGDESVLLTESEPGSVLPPEEPEATEEPEAPTEDTVGTEPSPAALLEPVGADIPLDPGSGTYRERWSAIQGSFVDEPLRAVESAGSLVAQMWHELERSITEQREALDGGWATESSTDDLRAAFRRYREMFNRLADLLSSTD